MTKLQSALEYITGADFISERMRQEREFLEIACQNDDPLLLDPGIKVGLEIQHERIKTVAMHLGIVASRISGIDGLIRLSQKSRS